MKRNSLALLITEDSEAFRSRQLAWCAGCGRGSEHRRRSQDPKGAPPRLAPPHLLVVTACGSRTKVLQCKPASLPIVRPPRLTGVLPWRHWPLLTSSPPPRGPYHSTVIGCAGGGPGGRVLDSRQLPRLRRCTRTHITFPPRMTTYPTRDSLLRTFITRGPVFGLHSVESNKPGRRQ